MDETKKLAVAYGGFACVLEGFDNPFPIMRKVVRYFQEVSEKHPDFAGYHQVADFEDLRDRLGTDAEAGSRLTLEPIAGGVQIRRFDVLAEDTAIAAPPPVSEPAEDAQLADDTGLEAQAHDDGTDAQAHPEDAEVWADRHDTPEDPGEEIHALPDEYDASAQEAAEQDTPELEGEQPHEDTAQTREEASADLPELAPEAEAEAEHEPEPVLVPEAEAEADEPAQPVETEPDEPASSDPVHAEARDHQDAEAVEEDQPEDEAPQDHHWHSDSLVFSKDPPAPAEEPPVAAEASAEDTLAEPAADEPVPLRLAPEPEPEREPEPEPIEVAEAPDPARKPVAALRLGPEMARKPDPEPETPATPSFIDTVETMPEPKGGLFRSRTPAPASAETPAAPVDKPASPASDQPASTEPQSEPRRRGLGYMKLGGLLRRKDTDAAGAAPADAPRPTATEEPARKPAQTPAPEPAPTAGRLRVVEGDAQETPPQPAAATPPPADVVREVQAKTPAAASAAPKPAAAEPKPVEPKPAAPKPAEAPRSAPSDAMKDRLHASFADQPEAAPTTMEIGPGEGDSDPGSPAGFARAVGAASLPEMMAAAAGYMMMIEGRERVSRPDIMTMVQTVAGGTPLSAEAKVKAFGKLVRGGQIVRADAGQFFLSAETLAEFQEKLNELV